MKNTTTSWLAKLQAGAFLLSALGSTVPSAQSASTALDRASDPTYDQGWQDGDNGGYGWGGAWDFSFTAGNSGHFVGDSASNGSGDTAPPVGDINSNGRAWGLFSSGGYPATAAASLQFEGALSVGQTLMIDVGTGFVEPNAAQGWGLVGFDLKNGPGDDVLRFYYAGGDERYTILADSVLGTLPAFTDQGLQIEFTLTSPSTYAISIGVLGAQPTVVTDALLTGSPFGQAIERILLYNGGAGTGNDHNAFFKGDAGG